jgi:hypothetical protein
MNAVIAPLSNNTSVQGVLEWTLQQHLGAVRLSNQHFVKQVTKVWEDVVTLPHLGVAMEQQFDVEKISAQATLLFGTEDAASAKQGVTLV